MLNRRLLRVKVMQSLYAHFQSEGADIRKGEKALMLSIEREYELYLLYLILPIELANVAEIQMEEARNKVLPTEADKNPNRRFVESHMIGALKQNTTLQKEVEERKLSWSADYDTLKKLWKKIRQSELYLNYLEEEEGNAFDRKFLEQMFKKFVLDNEDLYSLFQERSIYWDFDDNDFAITMAIRYFSKIKSMDKYKALPTMYKDEEDDLSFVKNLFRRCIQNDAENSKLIDQKTKNWEVDRIALIDVLMMKMAITEFLHFPSIPVKVTLNEYIEMAKLFSSPKSKSFINGVLDKLLTDFRNENTLKKMGRGLME